MRQFLNQHCTVAMKHHGTCRATFTIVHPNSTGLQAIKQRLAADSEVQACIGCEDKARCKQTHFTIMVLLIATACKLTRVHTNVRTWHGVHKNKLFRPEGLQRGLGELGAAPTFGDDVLYPRNLGNQVPSANVSFKLPWPTHPVDDLSKGLSMKPIPVFLP